MSVKLIENIFFQIFLGFDKACGQQSEVGFSPEVFTILYPKFVPLETRSSSASDASREVDGFSRGRMSETTAGGVGRCCQMGDFLYCFTIWIYMVLYCVTDLYCRLLFFFVRASR